MDTETVNRVITEITNRLGVGYSVFSDAVRQYAQARATEGLIYSVAIFSVIILAVAIFFFAVVRNNSIDSEGKVVIGFLSQLLCVLLFFGAFATLPTLSTGQMHRRACSYEKLCRR